MTSPFVVGDYVYHPCGDEGEVVGVDGDLVYVEAKGGKSICSRYNLLSFEKWPEPCHKRPFKPVLEKQKNYLVVSTIFSSPTVVMVTGEDEIYAYGLKKFSEGSITTVAVDKRAAQFYSLVPVEV